MKVFWAVLICIVSLNTYAQNVEEQNISNVALSNTEKMQKKYYQQALYYYFQGDYSTALQVMAKSKATLVSLDKRSQLFEAGLQVRLGLRNEAQKSLMALNNNLVNQTTEKQTGRITQPDFSQRAYLIDAKNLLTVTLLSLTEEFIEQGNTEQAQKSLSKITSITAPYYQQYHVLSQLAYWPNKPTLLPISTSINEDEPKESSESVYVQLNNALRLMQEKRFSAAISVLNQLKNNHWKAQDENFWQRLFSNEEQFEGNHSNAQLQNQAVADYAQLLLAQLYVQQENFEQAYYELKAFPQNSPYSESALYLFAYSAQQSKQYTVALNMLALLYQQYPNTQLGWQAAELMAQQMTSQHGLSAGLHTYQQVETFFENKVLSLHQFEQDFMSSHHLSVDSVWLLKAKQSLSIAGSYQQLVDLQNLKNQLKQLKTKNTWLINTIALNQRRKNRIVDSQQVLQQQSVLNALKDKRTRIESALNTANNEVKQTGTLFANASEQKMLMRLQHSKQYLSYISEHASESKTPQKVIQNTQIDHYKQRLSRIESVLKWQLHQQFPSRSWQHKQQLTELNEQFTQVDTLLKHVDELTDIESNNNQNNTLVLLSQRQQKYAKQLTRLNNELVRLMTELSKHIQKQMLEFIHEQRTLLEQHLQSTRSAMANVLENMSIQDEKIKSHLAKDNKLIQEPL